jgi:hypothetical protein
MVRMRSVLKGPILWYTGAVCFLGAALWAIRPARLIHANVSTITPGEPPIANVVLTYGSGALPISVVVDVVDQTGHGGSATVAGTQAFLEIPLNGTPSDTYRVTATVTYQLLGMPLTIINTFA